MSTPIFDKLWAIKAVDPFNWLNYSIHAETTQDIEMIVWNGRHPVEDNQTSHICPKGTRVRVWMVSRFGDVGITDNLVNPRGYDVRVDPDIYLTNLEIV